MRARFYSTKLGRFLSPDPLVGGSSPLIVNLALSSVQGLNLPAKLGSFAASRAPNNPQSLDRYSYVLNNPLRHTDPTGLGLEELTPDQARALVALGEALLGAGVAREDIAGAMLAMVEYKQCFSSGPTGAPTHPGIDVYGGVEFAVEGGLGLGAEVKIDFVIRDGHLHMLIKVGGGGYAGKGVFATGGPVVGAIPENQSFEGWYVDQSICAGRGYSGCASVEEGPGAMSFSPQFGVGGLAGASGMAGQTIYDVDLGDVRDGLRRLKDLLLPPY